MPSPHPNAEEAREALAAIEQMQARGLKRGVYSRRYAAAIALWAGALAATLGTLLWLLVFILGLMAHHRWRKGADSWILEVRNRRDLWITLFLGILVGAIFLAGYIGLKDYGFVWAPLAAGVLVSGIVFGLMEIAYAPLRAHPSEPAS